jgi:hypothetical protein
MKGELDFSDFPPGTLTDYTTLVCLACIFDIFTGQIGLAPRSAYSEIKRYSPTVAELTARTRLCLNFFSVFSVSLCLCG